MAYRLVSVRITKTVIQHLPQHGKTENAQELRRIKMEDKFPKIKKSIQDFFEDEDGSITRNKVLAIGGMVIILGMLLAEQVYAAHRTHYTHRTHSSHRTSNKHGSHSSHYTSHSTHSDHYTHGSHSSHTSHVSYTDSKNYGSTSTSTGAAWPELSDIQSVETPQTSNIVTEEISAVLNAINTPQISQLEQAVDIQTPPKTPELTNNKE